MFFICAVRFLYVHKNFQHRPVNIFNGPEKFLYRPEKFLHTPEKFQHRPKKTLHGYIGINDRMIIS